MKTDPRTHETTEQQNNETTKQRTHGTTIVGRPMTVDFPENIYKAIHAKAGRLRMTKKNVIISALKGTARKELFIVEMNRDIQTALANAISKCKIDITEEELNNLI